MSLGARGRRGGGSRTGERVRRVAHAFREHVGVRLLRERAGQV